MTKPFDLERLRGVKVTEQLAEVYRRADDALRSELTDALEFYQAQFRRGEREQEVSPGGLAAGAHDAMTIWLEEAAANPPAGQTVQCRRGCAGCCRILVSVFPDEATLAVVFARHVGLEMDRAKLKRQAAASGSVKAWRRLSYEDRTCVFLRGEECGIYEHRPSACRKYMVVSPPERCDTRKYPGGETAMLSSNAAEVITSAAAIVWGWVPLPGAVLEALDKERQA